MTIPWRWNGSGARRIRAQRLSEFALVPEFVAETGLLDGKRATTHWYVLKGMLDRHPSIQYVPDRRLVADQNVVTTTGISASIPMTLTLIEAIAGREKAEAVALGPRRRTLGPPS